MDLEKQDIQIDSSDALNLKLSVRLDRAIECHDISLLKQLIVELDKHLIQADGPQFATLYYYKGTALSTIYNENKLSYEEGVSILGEVIWNYRHAIELAEKRDSQDTLLYQKAFLPMVYTNLGNAMMITGRKAFAMQYYREALRYNPTFGMAYGNMGNCLEHYGQCMTDPGYQLIFQQEMLECFEKAIEDPTVYAEARKCFQDKAEWYKEHVPKVRKSKQYTLGNGAEGKYRMWCLQKHFFLNPLNDLPYLNNAFATDGLMVGTIVTSTEQNKPPYVFEMLNQIKEEYVYARYLYFEAKGEGKVHFADRLTNLQDCWNNTLYSIRVEKLKTAYRTIYSLLDRTAFVINYYFDIGKKEREVSFNNIFNSPSYIEKEKDNDALLALHWINRDFKEKYGEEEKAYTGNLKELRDALEHKFVAVHTVPIDNELELDQDNIRYISEDSFITILGDLFNIIREVIIELVLAVNINESKKKAETAVSITLEPYKDEHKR